MRKLALVVRQVFGALDHLVHQPLGGQVDHKLAVLADVEEGVLGVAIRIVVVVAARPARKAQYRR